MNTPLLAAALALAVLTISAPRLAGQQPAPATPARPHLSFDFPGGTLAQLTAQLANASGGPLNIIGDPEDMKTPLPAFSMNNVHPAAFAQALSNFLQQRGLQLQHSLSIAGSHEVYTVRRNPVPLARSASRDTFEALQLSPFLGNHKVDDIIAAVRAAWELDPAHEPNALRLKYHPPTTILLVSGPQDAIEIAKEVVLNTLVAAPQKPRSQSERAEAIQAEVERRREKRDPPAERQTEAAAPAPPAATKK